MRVLMIGDVIGRPGRKAVQSLVPGLRVEYGVDLVVANAENVAGGKGLTLETAEALLQSGVDVMTSGNHIWAQKSIIPYLDGELPILRPLNYPPGAPGRGCLIKGQLMVVSLLGRTFMGSVDCPFQAMDRLLEEYSERPASILVDFHAEATSEKGAMGRYLEGRVSAVLGTHTHVGTVDAWVLPRGTAFVTDVGMVGPKDSVIGDDAQLVIQRFLTQMPHRLSVGSGRVRFNSVLVEIEDSTGKAKSIARLDREVETEP